MGSIRTRTRSNGEKAYTATIRLKDQGVLTVQESQTFSKKALAQAWMTRREAELQKARATGVPHVRKVTIGEVLDAYVKQSEGITDWGRSKTADIKRLRATGLANKDARHITVQDIVDYAKDRRLKDGAGPSTVLNDIIWLRQAFQSAITIFNLSHPHAVTDAAYHELFRLKLIAKPRKRDRRITPAEEAKIIDYFDGKKRGSIPMSDIVKFALLTARRQAEICRIKWVDVDFEDGTAWVDDVKHPTQKKGNRKQFRILKPALDIIERQPRVADEIFPYDSKSVGAAFTRAMHVLGLDICFHDTRHEATSRFFEKGYAIHEVAHFTLHDSWTTLKRYTHLRPADIPER